MKIINLFSAGSRYRRIFWYLLSGATAAFVDLTLLIVFVNFFHVWYITATTVAFIGAFLVSFFMQKTFTFQDTSSGRTHKQLIAYLLINVCNLFVNALLMYVVVGLAHVHYLIGQIIVAAIIALYSFFAYKYLIFRSTSNI